MDFNELEVFVEAAESDVYLTPYGAHRYTSSASEEVLALEKEMGVQLFIREGTDSGILTKAGEVFLEEAKDILKKYRKTRRKMDKFANKHPSELSIGALPLLRQYRLNAFLNRYTGEHPDQSFFIEQTDYMALLKGLEEDYYDAIICRKSMLYDIACNTYHLSSDEIAAVLPSTHRLANSTSVRLDQLKNEEFYLPNPHSSSYAFSYKLIKARHISTENVHTAEIEAILPAIAEKRGVALLPFSNLTRAKIDGITALPLMPKAAIEVVLAVKKKDSYPDALQELIDAVKTRATPVPE